MRYCVDLFSNVITLVIIPIHGVTLYVGCLLYTHLPNTWQPYKLYTQYKQYTATHTYATNTYFLCMFGVV